MPFVPSALLRVAVTLLRLTLYSNWRLVPFKSNLYLLLAKLLLLNRLFDLWKKKEKKKRNEIANHLGNDEALHRLPIPRNGKRVAQVADFFLSFFFYFFPLVAQRRLSLLFVR